MDDIDFAFCVSERFGQLYRDAKTFSVQAPAMTLTHLRGLAYEVCDSLDIHGDRSAPLSVRIKATEALGLLRKEAIRNLRTLMTNGNIAAHPEAHDYKTQDFDSLAADSLEAARVVLGHLLVLKGEEIPSYTDTPPQDSGLRDMCYQAMVEGDVEAIHQAGLYFKAKADQLSAKRDGGFTADGYCVEAREPIEQAIFWFNKGAAMSHPNCMYQFGYYQMQTKGISRDLSAQAERLIARACDSGHVDAMFYVAERLFEGDGIFVEDKDSARDLLTKAAEQNHPGALAKLGAVYATGVGCEVDHQLAAAYTIKAAEAGYPLAQYNLSVLYERGLGVVMDQEESNRWLLESANQEFPNAVYELGCKIHMGTIQGYSYQNAIDAYELSMSYREFRQRAALAIAELSLQVDDSIDGWIQAATHAQHCYELITREGDPHNLVENCLAAAKTAVTKIRTEIQRSGTSPSRGGNEVLTCLLFDRYGRPVTDRREKIAEFTALLSRAQSTNMSVKAEAISAMQDAAGLKPRGAVIDARMQESQRTIWSRSSLPAVGRNEPCPCGSGRKYKKCHGA